MDEQTIFWEALEREDEQSRNAYLDAQCGTDFALRQRIVALLRQHEGAASFLEKTPAEFARTLPPDEGTSVPSSDGDAGSVTSNGPASVLKKLQQTLQSVPQVALRTSDDDASDRVLKPDSTELPGRDPDSRYQLQGEIARGGMGAVIKGRDVDLGRDLAIKVLLESHQKKPELVQRFVEEAQIGGQLQHPGIAPVYELGQFGDQRPFFSMKLVKGETLAAILAERNDPREDRARLLGTFEQVCQTMAYAHSKGVIHRDLKPANIMVGAFGEVQVMDWGLAKVIPAGGVADEKRTHTKQQQQSIIQTIRSLGSSAAGGGAESSSSAAGSQTQMGSVMGTPAYMPPEQALGEVDRLDERSDVFALGAIMCEILTGAAPYTGHTTEVFRKASRGNLGECTERLGNCGADDELLAIVRHCLELEPADRPRNGGALSDLIAGYLAAADDRLRQAELDRLEAETRTEEERKRRKVIVALAASLLAMVTLASGSWIWAQQKDVTIERQALEQRQELEQQIQQKLSAARVLANLDSEEFPSRAALQRATAVSHEAAELSAEKSVDQRLLAQLKDIQSRVGALKRDSDLSLALEDAWEFEMEQRERQRSVELEHHVPWSRRVNQPTSRVLDPIAEYQRAFADWGLSPGITVEQATSKLNAVHPTLRPALIASLDRWRSLLLQPASIDRWQKVDWQPLRLVRPTVPGTEGLELTNDGAILASQHNVYPCLSLTFESDAKRLSALRLETLTHDSLANGGPGRSGDFSITGLRVYVAPRSDASARKRLDFAEAVADYSWISDRISTTSWNNHGGSGQPHMAVFALAQPVVSNSGFRIWIETPEILETGQRPGAKSPGHFRWSLARDPLKPALTAEKIREITDAADENNWRRDVRRAFAESNIPAVPNCSRSRMQSRISQVNPLIQIADTLNAIKQYQRMKLLPNEQHWHVLKPVVKAKRGTIVEVSDDAVIRATGPNPNSETLTLTASTTLDRITALRLELIPDASGEPRSWSRKGDVVALRELTVELAVDDKQSKFLKLEPIFVFADYPFDLPIDKAVDGRWASGAHLTRGDERHTLVVGLDPRPFDSIRETPSSKKTLRVTLKTGRAGSYFDLYRHLSRFRISVSDRDTAVDQVATAALSLLEAAAERSPDEFWLRLAAADTLRSIRPPRLQDALRHASAAVALRPNEVAGHAAVLRSIPVDRLRADHGLHRFAIAHLGRVQQLDSEHPVIHVFYDAINSHASGLRHERALDYYKMLLDLGPTDPKLLYRVAYDFQHRLEMDELAIDTYERAIEVDSEYVAPYVNIGVIEAIRGRPDAAIRWYRKAIALEPERMGNYDNLALSLGKLERTDEAIDMLREAVKICPPPGNGRLYSKLCWCLKRRGDSDEAIDAARKAIELMPSYAFPYINLVWLLREQGETQESAQVARQFLANCPAPTNPNFVEPWE